MHVFGHRIEHFASQYMPFGIEADYAMGLFWWLLLATAILILFKGEDRHLLSVAWLVKFFVTLGAMLLYEQGYDLDAYTYFKTAVTGEYWMYPGYDFRQDMWLSWQTIQDRSGGSIFSAGIGTENMVRCMVLMASITGPYYHAMKVCFSFLGLLGVWWFYQAVVAALGRPCRQVFYLLAFFPSILFWSSILGKDPLQFLFLGIYAYGGVVWLAQGRFSGLWYVGIGAGGSYLLRPWSGIMVIGLLGLSTLLGRCRAWQMGLTIVAMALVVSQANPQRVLQAAGLDIIDEPGKLQEILESKAEGMAQGSKAKAGVAQQGQGNLALAVFSGLFRPLPFDITNPFVALAAVENSVILVLVLVGLFRSRIAYFRDSLVLWPLLLTVSWALLYGFIVMANFGSGVRYKLQILPFFLLVVICLFHKQGRAFLDSRLPSKRT